MRAPRRCGKALLRSSSTAKTSVGHESLPVSHPSFYVSYEVPTAINKHIIMATAAVSKKAGKKGLRSNSSSSTESVNSIPASSDEEAGPPIMLDEVQEKTKKKKKVCT